MIFQPPQKVFMNKPQKFPETLCGQTEKIPAPTIFCFEKIMYFTSNDIPQ